MGNPQINKGELKRSILKKIGFRLVVYFVVVIVTVLILQLIK